VSTDHGTRRRDRNFRGSQTRNPTPKEVTPETKYTLIVGKPFTISQPSRSEVWLDRLKTAAKWTSAVVAMSKLIKRLFDNLSG